MGFDPPFSKRSHNASPYKLLTLSSALEDEEQAHVMKTNLDAMLEEAKTAQRDLEGKAEIHTEAQKELDRLYEFVFQEPTPEFPEVGAREREVQVATKSCHHAQSSAEAEWQAVQCLRQAHQRLNAALMAMDSALRRSRQDMYGGGTYIDVSSSSMTKLRFASRVFVNGLNDCFMHDSRL